MLRPTKHSHPDKTVINASLHLIKRLRKRRLDNFDNLRNFTKKKIDGGDWLFVPALNFLYLLGLIEYHPKTDSIEYVGSNETV